MLLTWRHGIVPLSLLGEEAQHHLSGCSVFWESKGLRNRPPCVIRAEVVQYHREAHSFPEWNRSRWLALNVQERFIAFLRGAYTVVHHLPSDSPPSVLFP